MSTTASFPTKTILITTLPASSISQTTMNYHHPAESGKIGVKRPFSVVAATSSAALPVHFGGGNSILTKSTTMATTENDGPLWLPATVQRTYKYEPIDEYDYSDETEGDAHEYTELGGQHPRKRERLTHLTAEEKMFRRKMKNRIAAQTARDRKKALMVDLEETVRRLEEENDSLLRENSKLRDDQCNLAEENERLKKQLLSSQQQQKAPSSTTAAAEKMGCRNQDDAHSALAVGPAEGASQDRVGVDLVSSIRSNPAVLDLLRQIVAGGGGEDAIQIGGIERERQLQLGDRSEGKPAGGGGEITIDNPVGEIIDTDQTTVIDSAFVPLSSAAAANNDHQYFSSSTIISSSSPQQFPAPPQPASTSFSISDFSAFDSLLHPPPHEPSRLLFPTNDTTDGDDEVDLYFNKDEPVVVETKPSLLSFHDTITTTNTNTAATLVNDMAVPTSPTNTTTTDFHFSSTFGDDLLDEALQSLGDFAKYQHERLALPTRSADSTNTSSNNKSPGHQALDLLETDDFRDLWEVSFSQIFPSLSSA